MLRPFLLFAPLLLTPALVAACGSSDTPADNEPDDGVITGGSGNATGGSGSGNTTATGGSTSGSGGSNVSGSGGASNTGGGTSSGGGSSTGGSNVGGSGGTSNTGGSDGGGGTSTGGSNVGGSQGGISSSGGDGNQGGGMGNTGGVSATGGSAPDLDENGKGIAAPGDSTSSPQDYLRLGEIRILNNNWGSAELGCNAPMSVFVNQDGSFGWSFSRGDCDTAGSGQKPDFPQVEFGIHPFGIGDELVTSPEFSSTTLLPLQIKDIQSASVSVENLVASLQNENSWNITFEFWLSERHPVTDPDPGVHTELMTFWGWQNGRWPAPPDGTGPTGNGAGQEVSSSGKTYTLWVQDDAWANGQWRYYQFRANDGPQKNFNGTVDVKPFLDYLVSTRGYSSDLWVTRLEVGSEIDDNTQGMVQMSGITFEVNGQSRSEVIASN